MQQNKQEITGYSIHGGRAYLLFFSKNARLDICLKPLVRLNISQEE